MKRLLAVVVLVGLGVAGFVVARDGPDVIQRIRYPIKYEQIVRSRARTFNLDPALVAAMIFTESKFDADARSDAGAIGLMQLLPDTAREIAVRTGGDAFVVDDLYVPELNIRFGSWYLRHLLDRYGNEQTALAAYHAGQGNVDRWRKQGVGIQFPETRSYVAKVERVRKVYASLYEGELGLG